jgi:molecular chaperone Hsp33
MEREPIPGLSNKDLLRASAADKRYNFLLAGGELRGVVVNATLMTNQMKANHDLGVLETLALGHAGIGAALMAANLKGSDRLNVQIDCSGPLKGLSVDANAFGEVRGFLKAVPIPVAEPPDRFDLAPCIGEGFLSVTRYLADARQPFTGKIALGQGAIALELANYYLVSEQTPSAFSLSVHFDHGGVGRRSGGAVPAGHAGSERQGCRPCRGAGAQPAFPGKTAGNGAKPLALYRNPFCGAGAAVALQPQGGLHVPLLSRNG